MGCFRGYFWGYQFSPSKEYPQVLSIQQIKNARAGEKPTKLYDRDGLYLVITPAGGKLWRGKYRVDGGVSSDTQVRALGRPH